MCYCRKNLKEKGESQYEQYSVRCNKQNRKRHYVLKVMPMRNSTMKKLKKMQYQDEYHMALCYCLGISDDTRRNIDRIYDFETGCVKPACLYEGWQTSGSKKIVRMAFNLYCNGTPSVDEDTTTDEQAVRVQTV